MPTDGDGTALERSPLMRVGHLLLDRAQVPDEIAFEGAAGAWLPQWHRLVDWLRSTYGLEGEPLYGGRDEGWLLRFRRSGRSLLTMIPQAIGPFRVQVVIGPGAWPAVASANLSPAMRAAWDAAKPYPDGKWIWREVTDAATVEDVLQLVAIKSPPPKRPRVKAA
jgi:hypothetical protein